MHIKSFVSSLFCIIGLVSNGAEIPFLGENESGSGDVALAANWGNETIPGASDTAKFNKSGEITSSGIFSAYKCSFSGSGLSWVLKDGNIEAKDAVAIGSIGGGENTFTIEEGASLTTLRDFWLGTDESSPMNKLIVKSGGSLNLNYATSPFRLVYFGEKSYGNIVENYGTIVSTNSNYYYLILGVNASSSNNLFTCDDGSYFDTKGNIWVGKSGSNNKFIVKEGATFKQSNGNSRYFRVGEGASSTNNQLIIEKGAIFSSAAPIYVGDSGSDNTVILDDYHKIPATMSIGINPTAHRNKVVFRGTEELTDFNLNSFTFGDGTNNELRIEGRTVSMVEKTPTISPVSSRLTQLHLDKGCGNKVVMKDSTVNFYGNFYGNEDGFAKGNGIEFDNTIWNQGRDSSGNGEVRFVNNATITVKNNSTANLAGRTFAFGTTVEDAQNTLNLLNNSIMNVGYFRMVKSNNKVVISDSVLKVNSNTTIPYVNGSTYEGINTNNVFRFEGAAPSFTSTGSITFMANKTEEYEYGKTILEFVLPLSAYEKAPITATSITIKRGNKINVVLPAKEEQSDAVNYVICEAGTGVITIEDMEDLATDLPETCKLSLSDDKKKLTLRALKNIGLRVIIK